MSNIVYLHGFASSPESTKAKLFYRNFAMIGGTVHVPDLAQGDFEGLTIKGQLKVVDETVRELQPVLLIGSSLGGYLAALYASRQPEQVKNLVLLAPAFAFAKQTAESLGPAEMEKWKKDGKRMVHHYGEMDLCPIGYQLYEDAQKYEDFPDVTQRTLIYHGRFDDVADPQLSVQFSWEKPNVTLELFDSDHELRDVIDEIWERVAVFYQELEPLAG